MKPLCFMIMPYGRKPTQTEANRGPAEVNFDALWDRAYVPIIQDLGYEPVRADQDSGALIINQMIERLYFADLVLADMTIPNGNVYYEVGIRHACKENGCVLLAADWSKALFDVVQMRTLRYPLPEGDILDATAQAIIAASKDKIKTLAGGSSPVHESIKGYPRKPDQAAASTMKGAMLEFATFQGEIRALRGRPRWTRMEGAKKIVANYWRPPVTSPTALAIMRMLKDSAEVSEDWLFIVDFIGNLPDEFRKQEEVRELHAFALSNAGKYEQAIADLEGLIEGCGPTPERLGILGGRYKRLYTATQSEADKAFYLDKCIEAYERGMDLDLNNYYCSSNLPRLYRQRNIDGDSKRAHTVSMIVIAACERARKLGVADEWLRPTLLGTAFDDGDCDKADELAKEVVREGPALWKIDTTVKDLRLALQQVEDAVCKKKLAETLKMLEKLCETKSA